MGEETRAARGQGESALRRLIAVALVGLACASPGMPPGGPPDVAAPQIVAIAPDSGRTGIKPKEVIIRFDEVVSERPPSYPTLADLFIISPKDGTPSVSWNRDEIAVRPRRGWLPNTAYTVTMLAGLSDIRGNVRNTGVSTFFSTGPTIPRTRITGLVFDWVTGAIAAGAFVESFVQPDSNRAYIAIADSSGFFALEHMPLGRYTLRAFVDRNKNRGIDPGESWDSISVALGDSVRAELLVFAHDSIPPRIRDIAPVDSLSLRVTFDRPVDPRQTLSTANFAVIGPDSAPMPIVSVGATARDTAPQRRLAPPAPSPARSTLPPPSARDTATRVRPVMSRPVPIGAVTIRLQRPLTPKTTYRVRSIGLRGLLGHTGDSDRAYTAPTPPPPAAPEQARPATQAAPPVRR